MYVSVNEKGEIKEVGVTSDLNLTSIFVDETIPTCPFRNWSKAKICCYKVRVDDNGNILSLTPYIDTRMVEQLDRLSVTDEENEEMINANTDGILEVYESTDELSSKSNDLEDAVLELYEMLGGTE